MHSLAQDNTDTVPTADIKGDVFFVRTCMWKRQEQGALRGRRQNSKGHCMSFIYDQNNDSEAFLLNRFCLSQALVSTLEYFSLCYLLSRNTSTFKIDLILLTLQLQYVHASCLAINNGKRSTRIRCHSLKYRIKFPPG